MRPKITSSPQNKKYIRKILLAAAIIGTLGFLLLSAWNYTKPVNLPIKQVKIFATYEHVDKKALQKIVADSLEQGFFYLNVISLKQQLLKLPWVYAVSIERHWPDTLTISIAEQRAILQWGTKALINPDGKIFTPPTATFPRQLPILFGQEEQEPIIFSTYHKMLTVLDPLDLTIKKLTLDPEHYWEIELSNNTLVYLKEEEPLGQLELLANLYRKITANRPHPPRSLDLRYSTGLAVKWD